MRILYCMIRWLLVLLSTSLIVPRTVESYSILWHCPVARLRSSGTPHPTVVLLRTEPRSAGERRLRRNDRAFRVCRGATNRSPPEETLWNDTQYNKDDAASSSASPIGTMEPLRPKMDPTTTATTTVATNASDRSSTTTWAVLLLNGVAVLWGTQHAVIKGVVVDTPLGTSIDDATAILLPALLTLVRFTIAAVLASPPAWASAATVKTSTNSSSDSDMSSSSFTTLWRWGLEMGFWMFLGFALQAIGLQTTTAQRSGFLLYLNVKFVPFFAYFLYQRPIGMVTWISALTAFTGTALLAYAPATTTMDTATAVFGLNTGDLWTMAAAAASAMFILRLETASQKVTNAAQLNAASLWIVSLLALLWTLAALETTTLGSLRTIDPTPFFAVDLVNTLGPEIQHLLQQHGWELLYLGGVTTALANWIQTKAQRSIRAERAAIIYAMDPVYGAVFSYWLLGETLNGITGWLGAALIVLAAATNAMLLDNGKESPLNDD